MLKTTALLTGAALLLSATAFAQADYHVTGRVLDPTGGPNNNQVWIFDSAGNVSGQYDQIGTALTDTWGYRDGATDGMNRVYFGWGGGVARHNSDGTGGVEIISGGAPSGVGTWRALAFDPTGDGGNGSLWVCSFGSELIETDLLGNLLNNFANGGYSLYGLAFDDSDGNLFGHSTGGEVVKISTADGTIIPGGWPTGFANLAAQGGLSGYSELGGLAALSQGTPDEMGNYDTTGTLTFGPIDVEAQTGTNGNLGIAVTSVVECWLMVGVHQVNVPLPWSLSDNLYVLPQFVFPVTLNSIPVIAVPDDPTLIGAAIYSQIYMDNAIVFPNDPYKVSNGLQTIINGGSTRYGTSTGMTHWEVLPTVIGGEYRVTFSID